MCHRGESSILTWLLTTLHTLFRFYQFFSHSFCVPRSLPRSHIHLVGMTPLPAQTSFVLFLIIWQFSGLLVRHFIECYSIWVFVTFFSWLYWSIGFWEDKEYKTEVLFSYYFNIMLSIWLNTSYINLNHLVKVVFAMCLHYKVTYQHSFIFFEADYLSVAILTWR